MRWAVIATLLMCAGSLFAQTVSQQCSTGPVTAYTASTSPVPITVTGTMPVSGAQITISGVTTPSAMNGKWTITNTGLHTATLNGSGSMTGTFSGASSKVLLTFGNVVCTSFTSNAGSATNQTSSTNSGFTSTLGDGVLMFTYMCSSYPANASQCVAPADWVQSHTYAANAAVNPTSNNPCSFNFVTTAGLTSGSSRPTFSTTPCNASAATVSDNGGTWTKVTMTISDNVNTPETCFTQAVGSPVALQNLPTYLNYLWYCPSIPTGVTSFTLTCTVTTSCSFFSMFAYDLTNMCNTAPCFDGSAVGANGVGTSASVATGALSFTNDLIVSLLGSVNDELDTPNNSCFQIDQAFQGNTVMAKTASGTSAQTCGATWTGSDTWGIMIGAIKTAASAGTCPFTLTTTGAGCR